MNETRHTWRALLLLVALVPVARTEAAVIDNPCANGAVNTITNNYATSAGAGVVPDGGENLAIRCEIALIVRVQVAQDGRPDSWEEVARVSNLWTDAQAHELMFRIGQCGLIVPQFERVGLFYGTAVPMRIEAIRLPPCF